jgi:hypothetical protein
MKFALFGALVGAALVSSGAASAQDVTYPFEADQAAPAAKAAKTVKPKQPKKEAKAVTAPVPTPEPKPAAGLDTRPEIKIEAKIEAKAEAKAEPPRDALPGVSAQERDKIGWSVVLDPITGIQLGLPANWVPTSRQAANGTHWSSRHGDIQVETFRIKTIESLNALFERMKREPSTRRVETSTLKPDNFIVTGLQGLKKFGVRAQLRNGELRGYTVMYDQMMEGIVAPVTAAMAGAFAPFPETVGSIALLSKPVDYGTGLIVSADGHILTDRRHAENCTVISVTGFGNAERVGLDRDRGLALLRVYGKRDLKPAAFDADTTASEFTLVGVPDPQTQDGGMKLAEVKARVTEGNAIRLRDSVPVAGFSGAAALDAKGRALGIMETRNALLAGGDIALPPVRLVPGAAVRDFLQTHGVTPPLDAGDARDAVVRVICVRGGK